MNPKIGHESELIDNTEAKSTGFTSPCLIRITVVGVLVIRFTAFCDLCVISSVLVLYTAREAITCMDHKAILAGLATVFAVLEWIQGAAATRSEQQDSQHSAA